MRSKSREGGIVREGCANFCLGCTCARYMLMHITRLHCVSAFTSSHLPMRLAKTSTLFLPLLFALASTTAQAQVNVGEQKAEDTLPFTLTTTETFQLPWRIAFLPDGRMLVTEKPGPVWLVSKDGKKVAQ